VPLVGTRSGIAQAALNFVGRDATATEPEIEKYYADNQSLYTLSAEATVTKAEFATQAAAEDFRAALLAGEDTAAANEASAGTITELGRVKPGDLQAEFDTALFSTDAFDALPGGSLAVSDILVLQVPDEAAADATAADATATDATSADATAAPASDDVAGDGGVTTPAAATRDAVGVLVADRVPARVRSLADVHAQVEQAVVAQKRQVERTGVASRQARRRSRRRDREPCPRPAYRFAARCNCTRRRGSR